MSNFNLFIILSKQQSSITPSDSKLSIIDPYTGNKTRGGNSITISKIFHSFFIPLWFVGLVVRSVPKKNKQQLQQEQLRKQERKQSVSSTIGSRFPSGTDDPIPTSPEISRLERISNLVITALERNPNNSYIGLGAVWWFFKFLGAPGIHLANHHMRKIQLSPFNIPQHFNIQEIQWLLMNFEEDTNVVYRKMSVAVEKVRLINKQNKM